MAHVQDIFPLSPMQQGMLFHSLYAPEIGVYVEQRWCVIEGELDIPAFQQAWHLAINHHDALRAEFHWEETDEPVQVIYDEVKLEWSVGVEAGVQNGSIEDQHAEFCTPANIRRFIESDRTRGFDFDRSPLMRFALFPLDRNRYQFIWTFPHLLMDGWCNALLIKEVFGYYENLRRGNRPRPLPGFSYRQYIDWLETRSRKEEEDYWRKTLAGVSEPTCWNSGLLPKRAVLNSATGDTYREVEQRLGRAFTARLKSFAAEFRLTLNTLFQGAWAVLLQRYSGNEDVLFGATVSGRPADIDGIEGAVGLFINTVPVRIRFENELTVSDWLSKLQQDQRDREWYGYARLIDLQKFTEVPHGVPLFDSLVVFENYPVSTDDALSVNSTGLTLSDRGGYERTNYPLTVVVIPGDELTISMRFDSSQFTEDAVRHLLEQIHTVLHGFMEASQQPIGDVSALSEIDRRIIDGFEGGESRRLSPTPICECFREQARIRPTKSAIVFPASNGETVHVDYSTLDMQSDAIAFKLREMFGVGRGSRVGVLHDRNPMMVAALLGVLKSGAAYVPLDRDFPESRLRYMVEDAELEVLVHDGEPPDYGVASLSTVDCQRFDSPQSSCDQVQEGEQVDPSDLAYIIYTSGSTGKPKGVAITHANLSNFLTSMQEQPGLNDQDCLLAVTTISFDIAALELFLPLVVGAEIVLATTEATRSGNALEKLIAEYGVSIMQATPATWRLLVDEIQSSAQVDSSSDERIHSHSDGRAPSRSTKSRGIPEKILCGGEALDISLAEQLLAFGRELWNMYGPTETTIWSGAIQVSSEHLERGFVPIGGPILNTRLAVFDKRRQRVPVGATGELHIAGAGLSPGYWRRSELTSLRFVDGWYATGDLVRLRSDGLIDFLKRVDHQVKIRGYRIELGEIESALQEYPGVAQAVAIVRDESIVAFVCAAVLPQHSNLFTPAELRQHLLNHLPSYMIPIHFEYVDEFPKTLNGKIDRKTLSTCSVDLNPGLESGSRYASPREELVAGVWGDVLSRSVIQPQDNFFELGGHSLAATRVVGRVRQVVGVDVPLRLLFEFPTLREFVAQLGAKQLERVEIPRISDDVVKIPLSDAQRRQWLLAGLSTSDSLYSIPTAVRIHGPLQVARLRASLEQVVAKHEVLRMCFREELGEPFGYVLDEIPIDIEFVDLSSVKKSDQKSKLRELIETRASSGFDAEQAPLWRAALFFLGRNENVFLLNFHHILVDGWSLGILTREIAESYSTEVQDVDFQDGIEESPSAISKSGLPLRYRDYGAWQNERDFSSEIAYWRKQLDGLPPLLELPTDFVRPPTQSYAGATLEFKLNSDEVDSIRRLGNQQGATLFMTLFAAFNLLLYRYTGTNDFAVGTPVANRDHPDFEDVVGLFVNTLVLRSDLTGNPTVRELLDRIRTITLEAYQHGAAPFEQVLDAVGAERTRANTPLFQVLFTVQNAPLASVQVDEIEWIPVSVETGTSKFDLSLSMREQDGELVGRFEYRTDLFRAATIERMAIHYRNLIQRMPDLSEQRLSSQTLLSKEEQEQFAHWNTVFDQPDELRQLAEVQRTAADREATIHSLFSSQSLKSPNAIALVQGDQDWTYQELETKSNEWARHLVQLGVTAETSVGVITERCPETIIALLAILKAGGVYVPLDRHLPESRLEWIQRDASCLLVIDPRNWDSKVKLQAADESRVRTPALAVRSESLAYILYTSGSTGVPKGVCTPHRGVIRLVRNSDYAEFGPEEVFLQAASLGFDASTFEIWGALLNGGKLVLPETEDPSLADIAALIKTHKVSTLWLTAGLFHLMMNELPSGLVSLKQLLAGGDVLSLTHLRKASQQLPSTQLINGYGPTEGTTFTCCHRFSREELSQEDLSSAPIGRAINGTQIYVLDEDLQRVPVGVPGELYLGGEGLARGYLNDPALTAERFVPNPFFNVCEMDVIDQNITLYKTGDRVRFGVDGAVEFLGRLDEQVKIRGFRIEPAEVEIALKQHPQIRDAVVMMVDKQLIGYLVALQDEETLSLTSLRAFLSEHVPTYLIPNRFAWLDELPLNTNGKVDRSALAELSIDAPVDAVATRNPTEQEQRLLGVWKSVIPNVDIQLHSNFFEIGGDSIIALQLVSRAARVGLQFTPAQLFQFQTVAELAEVVETDIKKVPEEFTTPTTKEFSLTPIQHWLLDQDLADLDYFHQSVTVEVPGDIDHKRLDEALAVVFGHHDSLRLQLVGERQVYAEVIAPKIEWIEGEKVLRQLKSLFRLDRASVFKAFGWNHNRRKRLTFVAHHFVIDAVSWRIFLEDLYDAYSQAGIGRTVLLPAKTASYQAWSTCLRSTVQEARKALDYWQEITEDSVGVPPGDPDKRVFSNKVATSSTVDLQLSKDLTRVLVKHPAGKTTSILLAAFAVAIRDAFALDRITIDLESHGRDAESLGIDLDVSRTIGWFTSVHPISIDLSADLSNFQMIRAIQAQKDAVPHGGLSYGILRYLDGRDNLRIQSSIAFNYLGQLSSSDMGVGFRRVVSSVPNVAPENRRSNAWDLNCWVDDGAFQLVWTFDREQYSESEMRQLVSSYENTLIQLLSDQTLRSADRDSSAFDLTDLDAGQLDDILSQVRFGVRDD